jgi:hypothetical protein
MSVGCLATVALIGRIHSIGDTTLQYLVTLRLVKDIAVSPDDGIDNQRRPMIPHQRRLQFATGQPVRSDRALVPAECVRALQPALRLDCEHELPGIFSGACPPPPLGSRLWRPSGYAARNAWWIPSPQVWRESDYPMQPLMRGEIEYRAARIEADHRAPKNSWPIPQPSLQDVLK